MNDHAQEKRDPAYRAGAVETGTEPHEQVLPVWASTEPLGYAGAPADQQLATGEGSAKGRARRNEIGPGAD